jgi:hypothetical protein
MYVVRGTRYRLYLTSFQEVDTCKSVWRNVGTKIQKVQIVVDSFRSQCLDEGMSDEELPDMIKMAFKDFELYVVIINPCHVFI